MKATLVLGSEPRISLTIARSLARNGIPVVVAALMPEEATLRSKAVTRFARLPRVASGEFGPALVDLIRTNNIDTVMPASDTALDAIALYHDELRMEAHLCCPSPVVIDRVLQKEKTLAAANKCGVPVPSTFLIPDREHFDALRDTLRFPVIGKSRSKGSNGRGFKIRHFGTREELATLVDQEPDVAARCLFQEYCYGDGVGVEVLMHAGDPLAVFQHRRIKESATGVSVVAIAEPVDPQLRAWAISLLRQLGLEGIAMVEFRNDLSTGRTVLMEVNGRYWGSISLSLYAGLNFPMYEWQLAHGETPKVPDSYRTGIRVRWLAGDLSRMRRLRQMRNQLGTKALLRETAQFLYNFRPSVRGMVFRWSDPWPAVMEIAGTTRVISGHAAKGVLGRLFGDKFLDRFSAWRALGPRVGRQSLKLRIGRALKSRREPLNETLSRAQSVLFVCYGNIIRSPMAAALLSHQLEQQPGQSIQVKSAGMKKLVEAKADRRAIIVAEEFGIDLETHRPATVTRELVENADAIFVMDYLIEAMLVSEHPSAHKKIFLLGEVAPVNSRKTVEVKDPYTGGIEEIRNCYREILQLTDLLVNSFAGTAQYNVESVAGSRMN